MPNFLLIILLLLPLESYARVTLDNVSDALLQEFYSKEQKRKDVFSVEKKETSEIRTQSMTFALGDQVYKLVIFGDGELTLSFGQRGDVALQELLHSTADKTTPKQIIRLIQGLQGGPQGPAQGYQKPKDTADKEGERVKMQNTADALRWSGLINRVISGETMNISTEKDAGLGQSVSAARMMDKCQGGGATAGAATATNSIAEALVMANFAKLRGQNESMTANSREFEKRGKYSFFDEMDQFNQASPERAYQLMQKTKTSEYEIFQNSLQKSNIESRDPYFLAANRNFMFLVRTIGKKETLALMETGMKKIALSIERFVEYRKILPASSIIYDRIKDKFYIDPTLNQPTQARYLLSLVCMYQWKNQDKAFLKKLEIVDKDNAKSESERKTQVEELFKMYKDFIKSTSHPRFE